MPGRSQSERIDEIEETLARMAEAMERLAARAAPSIELNPGDPNALLVALINRLPMPAPEPALNPMEVVNLALDIAERMNPDPPEPSDLDQLMPLIGPMLSGLSNRKNGAGADALSKALANVANGETRGD